MKINLIVLYIVGVFSGVILTNILYVPPKPPKIIWSDNPKIDSAITNTSLIWQDGNLYISSKNINGDYFSGFYSACCYTGEALK